MYGIETDYEDEPESSKDIVWQAPEQDPELYELVDRLNAIPLYSAQSLGFDGIRDVLDKEIRYSRFALIRQETLDQIVDYLTDIEAFGLNK